MTAVESTGERRRLCTIAARNYEASVLLLVRTFAEHHPELPITVLYVDKRIDDGYPDYATTIFTTEAVIEKRRDVLQRFVDASIKGWAECLNGDPKPAFGLTTLTDGKSETTIDVPIGDLRKGYAINGHKSAQEANTYVFCGNIATQ